jgi:hypothetical protein
VIRVTGDDEDLMGQLRSLFDRLDPVDNGLLEQARFAYTWRTVDAELAELSFDSLVDREMMAGVRDDGASTLGPRMLGFGAVVGGEDVAIEVEITAGSDRPVLVGQVLPARPGTVEVQSGSGEVTAVDADGLGRFRVEPVPGGPLRLRVRHGDSMIQTTWVSYVRD